VRQNWCPACTVQTRTRSHPPRARSQHLRPCLMVRWYWGKMLCDGARLLMGCRVRQWCAVSTSMQAPTTHAVCATHSVRSALPALPVGTGTSADSGVPGPAAAQSSAPAAAPSHAAHCVPGGAFWPAWAPAHGKAQSTASYISTGVHVLQQSTAACVHAAGRCSLRGRMHKWALFVQCRRHTGCSTLQSGPRVCSVEERVRAWNSLRHSLQFVHELVQVWWQA